MEGSSGHGGQTSWPTVRSARVDQNQREIVKALRAIGCSVVSLHRVGQGCPDLLIGYRGQTYLIEVKIPGEWLNLMQREWFERWRGQVAVVDSVTQAISVVQAAGGSAKVTHV